MPRQIGDGPQSPSTFALEQRVRAVERRVASLEEMVASLCEQLLRLRGDRQGERVP